MSKKSNTTIYDISKKLNISAATVSRALNNNPLISEKTRVLVSKTALQMDYKRNRLAQALKQGNTYNVGVVVPFINRNFFSSVISGIEEELSPKGYHVIICQSHEKMKTEEEQINTLLDTQIDGIFLSVSKSTKSIDHLKSILKSETPLIFFDRKIPLSGVGSAILDDFKAGFLATEHLIEQGCTRIAHLHGDFNLEIYKNRFEGYKAALEKHQIPFKKECVIETMSTIKSGKKAVAKLWKQDEKIDAIFAAGDYPLLGALQELKKRKVKIPQDICVVGFGNEPFTQYMELPITSIDQTPLMMGKKAAQIFLKQEKQEGETSIDNQIILSPKLLIRASSNRKMLK